MRKILLATGLLFSMALPVFAQTPTQPTQTPPVPNPVLIKLGTDLDSAKFCFIVWTGKTQLDAITGLNILSTHNGSTKSIGVQYIMNAHHDLLTFQVMVAAVVQHMRDVLRVDPTIDVDGEVQILMARYKASSLDFNENVISSMGASLHVNASDLKNTTSNAEECIGTIEKMIGKSLIIPRDDLADDDVDPDNLYHRLFETPPGESSKPEELHD